MKARIENGLIVTYPTLPGVWNNILNFQMALKEVIETEGFYDLLEPAIDPVIQRIGELYFDEINNLFTYQIIEKTANEISYEIAMQGWHHRDFQMRIIAPDALLIQAPGIETWVRYQGLPVVVENSLVYLYCDTILPQHQGLLEGYQNLITIETIPIL